MKHLGRTLLIVVAALLTVQGLAAAAAPPQQTDTSGSMQAAPAGPDRQALVREILDLWGNAPNPMVSENKGLYGDLRAALKLATVEQLLDARKARTYEDVWAALPKGATSETRIIPLAQGQRVPQVLGDTGDDLVFTPVTPCRIIDTRGGDVNHTGLLGPNSGRQFFVSGTDYSTEGGFAGSCGIPTSPFPAAVAINLTSTGQTGPGNLRAIQSGAGVPNVSLVNYVAGVNIANAAIVPACHNCSSPAGDIFIYSGNSQSHAVVDIMGYFNPPAATAVQSIKVQVADIQITSGSLGSVLSPVCPAGYTITGGGGGFESNTAGATVAFIHPYGANGSAFPQYNCGGRNGSGVTLNFTCSSVCARVPGH